MSDGPGTSFDPRIVLRPRSLEETLDLALAYARVHRKDFARVLVLSVGVVMAGLVALKRQLDLPWEHVWLVALAVTPILERIVTVYAGSHLFGNPAELRSGLVKIGKRLPLMLASAILISSPWLPMLATRFDDPFWIGVATLQGSVWLFLIPRTLYFSQVALLESQPTAAAWKRSWLLVSERFGRAVGFTLTTLAIRLMVMYSAELIVRFVVSMLLQLGEPLDTLGDNRGSWAALVGWFAAAQLVALARLFDYVDARTRREGWDIQVRFKAIAAKARQEQARRIAA